MMTTPSDRPSARQRDDLASPPLCVEIDHGHGMVAFAGGEAETLLRTRPEVAAAWPPIPDLTSILSGEPALLYRCGDLAIPLTASEFAALVGGELAPAEIARLRMVFGPAYEWGATFYAAPSAEPLHPRGFRAGVLRAMSRAR